VGDRASLRYFFPLPFILAFIIASFDLPWKKLLWIPVAISVLYLIPTLYYLSVEPTNYKAVQFVRTDLSDATNTIIWNDVGADTELPQNKSAYLLTDKNECASKCEATIQYNLEKDFKPLVLDAHSDPAKIIAITKNAQVYFVERAASSASAASTSPNLQLIAAFTNPTADLEYYSADDSGNYFDLKYFELSRYGPNIYIYKAVRWPQTVYEHEPTSHRQGRWARRSV